MFKGAPKYTEWRDDWEIMMDDFEEVADNCEYLMRTMETEEIRQSQWLASQRDVHKSWCVLMGVLGQDTLKEEGQV